jgi:hypothetical protein
MSGHFENDDSRLREAAEKMRAERQRAGLDGLTGDLACLIINTQPEHLEAAAAELASCTGYAAADAFEDRKHRTVVLRCPDSADILIRARLEEANPFREMNLHPKSRHLPDSRLESYVFTCRDLDAWTKAQRDRGTAMRTETAIEAPDFRYIETTPSQLTGHAIGMIAWKNGGGSYRSADAAPLEIDIPKPDSPVLGNIGTLDHVATRVTAQNRDPAILEFMGLTDYNFAFAIYVPNLNSITNVARRPDARFSLVFTSGIRNTGNGDAIGPTEQFIRNYGIRAHHMAFLTENIEKTDQWLRKAGMGFLSDLVGSPEEGLKQSFSAPSPHTLLVNEYIHRFGGFDGFFTQRNVMELTRATEKQ